MTKLQRVITQPGWVEGRKAKVGKVEIKDFAISVVAWCVCLIMVALAAYYVGKHEDDFNVPVVIGGIVVGFGFIIYTATIQQWWNTLVWAAGLQEEKADALAYGQRMMDERNRAQSAYEKAKTESVQAHDALRKLREPNSKGVQS